MCLLTKGWLSFDVCAKIKYNNLQQRLFVLHKLRFLGCLDGTPNFLLHCSKESSHLLCKFLSGSMRDHDKSNLNRIVKQAGTSIGLEQQSPEVLYIPYVYVSLICSKTKIVP